ncbi:SixA phosphatase family protein [Neisseria weaveri]|uniref:Phosphohistidine phosphatase n=1 Tax=Neisseria weaveri TaxID=28091 RepID=A0A448VLJ1_9NEIS|nr:histidine phosphatase family protein [Neisseria weaveri]EGV36747.1 hypothetical protein l13_06280 [Neisseria weaveri ATCC 51223]EGV38684.1 hypothetical protein l11_01310 [Neisseria weaveri LMG 5135]VEJ50611.1 phosphohistidine phosphatase [Neisseria weaveri]
MNLILWRHAQAEDQAETDLARILTATGHQQAEEIAGWLKPRLPEETEIWASEAARSQQTAAHLSHNYTVMSALNPLTDAETVLRVLAEAKQNSTIVIVGHQPWLGELCSFLLNQHWDSEPWSVKKGGFWWFKIQFDKHGFHSKLHAALTPKALETNGQD